MLQGVLQRPIHDLTILDRELPGALVRDRSSILDVRARLHDGSRADVEMQRRAHAALGPRLIYYGARDYGDQLVRGEPFDLLTPTAVVAWLGEPLFPELDRLHSIFELRERHTNWLLSDHFSIHLLQLDSLPSPPTDEYAARVERWARFFTARSDEDFERLASETPTMALATHTLDILSQDPETYRIARERADALRLYQIDLATTRAEGRAEGEAKILLKQLGKRFGPLSRATRARVEAATAEQLDRWAERVLTEPSLDEVLAP